MLVLLSVWCFSLELIISSHGKISIQQVADRFIRTVARDLVGLLSGTNCVTVQPHDVVFVLKRYGRVCDSSLKSAIPAHPKYTNFQLYMLRAILTAFNSRPAVKTGTRSKKVSFIPYVTAAGERILDVLVLPINRGNLQIHDPDAGRRQKDITPMRIVFSETGFLSEKQWLPVLAELKASWNIFHPGLTPALLMDNLGVHKTTEALDFCLNLGIQGFFLPANNTHLLQPLDDVISRI
ncbi:hypothetical protein BCR33DRAFT_295503 [Rhizoclosmatium globosum]|uniref:DDE-1 domain-containing protein n=1 Tax=Rhizoclosmatium globosum TaxID=329046 RepID=A0A1Y2C5Y7_9FUNG|nr:hypothetical protein BCR33DRAFT_295503 [Rhizoclosmatium globosum]|eukprot:ORY42460.1 hypothetical protein BCR33DRAFT_295503 [Rhizoclosmatium globosum]